jgi:hypothetical protein
MVEIEWHCRETRQTTEKTNIVLRYGHGEIPEGLSGSERLVYAPLENPLLFAAVQLQPENDPVVNVVYRVAASAHGSMQIQA